MSTEKLSELSKPVAWLAIYHGEVYDDAISITRSVVEAQADRFGWESALTEITPLYSQEYVSALLARIAELERILDGVTPVMIAGGWTAKGISDYAKSLETKLATPVRLPVVLMGYQSDDYRIGFMEGVEKSGDEVRAAGFTVEGDE